MYKKLLVLAVFVMCFAFVSDSFAKELKMGYVDMRKIFYEYKKTKDFNKKLEKEDGILKKEIEKRTEEIRKLRDELDMLSEQAQEKRQPELKQKVKELDDYRREKMESLIKQKDDLFKEIREDIMSVAAKYAKKNGYDFILDEAVFVYASDAYDITTDMITDLNK
ncbi:MAG: OmpH family outer membrane protein [Candidatus Omnitrophota bacterium]